MLLASVTDNVLYVSNSFWANATLNVLRMLLSTSKGFNAALTGVNEQHALLAMIKNRPNAINGWVLKMSDAKYRFSLQLDAMVERCVALPVNDRCHIRAALDGSHVGGCGVYGTIHFIDAYRLAANGVGGMRVSMEQRHQFDMRVMESVRELCGKVSFDLLRVMQSNIDYAVRLLLEKSSRLKWYHEGYVLRDYETEIETKIHFLGRLSKDVREVSFDVGYLLTKKNTPAVDSDVRGLTIKARALVSRYKSQTEYCPEAMSIEVLPEI